MKKNNLKKFIVGLVVGAFILTGATFASAYIYNPITGGGGGGTIGGSISQDEIAFGTGTDTIGGTANFQYTPAGQQVYLSADDLSGGYWYFGADDGGDFEAQANDWYAATQTGSWLEVNDTGLGYSQGLIGDSTNNAVIGWDGSTSSVLVGTGNDSTYIDVNGSAGTIANVADEPWTVQNSSGYQFINVESGGLPDVSIGDIDGWDSGLYFKVSDTDDQFQFNGSDNFLIGTVAYSFPTVQGGAGTVLTNDGSGTLSWTAGSSPITIANSTSLFSTGIVANSSDAENSNFFGYLAGDGTSGGGIVQGSNFFGNSAGQNASQADNSNFFGGLAGNDAEFAEGSNFFGPNAGQNATFGSTSNFFGIDAGNGATSASNSNFFGNSAGKGATKANNSIFIGYEAGYNDTVDNSTVAGTSILIGDNTSTGGHSNSIGLGNSATNTEADQFMIAPSIDQTVTAGDVYITSASKGIVMKDTVGGACYRVHITSGVLVPTMITCP